VPAIPRRSRPRAGFGLTLVVLSGLGLGLLAPTPAGAQAGPIQLFPTLPGQPNANQPNAAQPNTSQPQPASPATRPSPGGQAAVPQPGSETTGTPPQGFQVEGLAPPEVDSIGLDGGFDRTLWAGSDPQLVTTLLAQLPVTTANPALRALTRRLLITGAPLDGGMAGGRVLSARVERLLTMGDLDTAKRLLDQLPPSRGDSELARLAARVALLGGDDPGACQRANDLAPSGTAAFWAKIAVYCRLAAGDDAGARLGLDLLREAGQTDDAGFFKLASAVADGHADGKALSLPSPEAVHVALLRLAGLPLPVTSLTSPPAAVLTVAARDPKLAGNRQLEIAERAFQAGGITADELGAIYLKHAPAGDALSRVRSAWGPAARAMAYRAAGELHNPQDLARLLDATWEAAKGDERLLIAQVFAKRFADLPIDRSLLAVGPAAARALLATDQPLPAARWFALLNGEKTRDNRVQHEVASLVPLYALAGIGGGEAVPQLDEPAVAAWRQATPDADPKAERLFALLEGVGSPVPGPVWWHELTPPLQRDASVPVGALWRGLELATTANRLGETVLFALNMLNAAPAAAHPEVLTTSLRSLRAVGLDHEARQIAVATAVAMDL
jgi:hypothetical protein